MDTYTFIVNDKAEFTFRDIGNRYDLIVKDIISNQSFQAGVFKLSYPSIDKFIISELVYAKNVRQVSGRVIQGPWAVAPITAWVVPDIGNTLPALPLSIEPLDSKKCDCNWTDVLRYGCKKHV